MCGTSVLIGESKKSVHPSNVFNYTKLHKRGVGGGSRSREWDLCQELCSTFDSRKRYLSFSNVNFAIRRCVNAFLMTPWNDLNDMNIEKMTDSDLLLLEGLESLDTWRTVLTKVNVSTEMFSMSLKGWQVENYKKTNIFEYIESWEVWFFFNVNSKYGVKC